ncbi:MAG: Omp28-related outer membrane protein [Bacteroidales bacterium]|nr:Omp28-related outer membrane protein [Bacteroidales bacterium]
MKTKIIASALLLFGFGAWVWTACDKIPEDETRISSDLPEWQGKTVVLEDFTGVGCTNCPNAAEIAHGLQTLMGDKLIVVELHGQTETVTASLVGPQADGDPDLRNAAAAVYSTYWKVAGLPCGLINRQQAPGEVLSRARWRSTAIGVYGEAPVATIEATASLSGSTITVEAKGSFPQAYQSKGEIRVLTMILEDGFSVTQIVSGTATPGYIHNHVLRHVIDEAWGVKVLDANPAANSMFNYTGTVNVQSNWNKDNLSVAVLLCDNDTKEILNAAKVKLNQ